MTCHISRQRKREIGDIHAVFWKYVSCSELYTVIRNKFHSTWPLIATHTVVYVTGKKVVFFLTWNFSWQYAAFIEHVLIDKHQAFWVRNRSFTFHCSSARTLRGRCCRLLLGDVRGQRPAHVGCYSYELQSLGGWLTRGRVLNFGARGIWCWKPLKNES